MNNAAIHTLLDIALSTPRETADVFFTYWPHCHSMDIRIHTGGWRPDEEPAFSHTMYLDKDYTGTPESLLADVQAFIANINPESKLKAAYERLTNARREAHAADDEVRAWDAIRIRHDRKEEDIADTQDWTPESSEPMPMQDLHLFSVPEKEENSL